MHYKKLMEDCQPHIPNSDSFSLLPRASDSFMERRTESANTLLGIEEPPPLNKLITVDEVASNCSADDEVKLAFDQTFSAKTPHYGVESTCSFKLSKTRNHPLKILAEKSPGPSYRMASPESVCDIELSSEEEESAFEVEVPYVGYSSLKDTDYKRLVSEFSLARRRVHRASA